MHKIYTIIRKPNIQSNHLPGFPPPTKKQKQKTQEMIKPCYSNKRPMDITYWRNRKNFLAKKQLE